MGERVEFEVQGTGYRVQGTGHRVQGTGYRVQGTGYRVQGTGYTEVMARGGRSAPAPLSVRKETLALYIRAREASLASSTLELAVQIQEVSIFETS